VRSFLPEKGELVPTREELSRLAVGGRRLPACRERQVEEGRVLKTGRCRAGRMLSRGVTTPCPGPRVM